MGLDEEPEYQRHQHHGEPLGRLDKIEGDVVDEVQGVVREHQSQEDEEAREP